MATIDLAATKRSVIGKQVRALRRAGKLPAVLYGPGSEPTPIQLDARDASRGLAGMSTATLINLDIDGTRKLALVREIQRDSIRRHFMHVDFYEVAMDRAIRVEVRVELVGTSLAVRDFNGVLVRGLSHVEIECLPGDLIDRVEVDLGDLRTIGSAVHVKDVYVPKTVKVLSDPEEMIALVTYQAAEEGAGAPEGGVIAEPEVIEKGRKEEEEEE